MSVCYAVDARPTGGVMAGSIDDPLIGRMKDETRCFLLLFFSLAAPMIPFLVRVSQVSPSRVLLIRARDAKGSWQFAT